MGRRAGPVHPCGGRDTDRGALDHGGAFRGQAARCAAAGGVGPVVALSPRAADDEIHVATICGPSNATGRPIDNGHHVAVALDLLGNVGLGPVLTRFAPQISRTLAASGSGACVSI